MPGLGHRRSFGGSRPQTSPPRFLELAGPRRLCPRLRPAGRRFAHQPSLKLQPGMPVSANETERGVHAASPYEHQPAEDFRTRSSIRMLKRAEARAPSHQFPELFRRPPGSRGDANHGDGVDGIVARNDEPGFAVAHDDVTALRCHP